MMCEILKPTMKLEWVEIPFKEYPTPDDRSKVPLAIIPGYPLRGPRQYKLQQYWESVYNDEGEWRDIEIEKKPKGVR